MKTTLDTIMTSQQSPHPSLRPRWRSMPSLQFALPLAALGFSMINHAAAAPYQEKISTIWPWNHNALSTLNSVPLSSGQTPPPVTAVGTPAAAQTVPSASLPLCAPWNPDTSYQQGSYMFFRDSVWRLKPMQQTTVPFGSDPSEASGTLTLSRQWEARPFSECQLSSTDNDRLKAEQLPLDRQIMGPPTLTQARAAEAEKTATPLFQRIKASVRTLDNLNVSQVTSGNPANPVNVRRVERILSAPDWEKIVPLRDSSYTYNRFLQALAKFPAVCDNYTDGRNADAICRKTLATMFAHFAQETGAHDPHSPFPQWQQGLYFVRESGCSETGPGCAYNAECDPSTWQGSTWRCGKQADGSFNKYFGRGAKQLSYNYNYGPFSDAMFGSVQTLLDHPDIVADTWLNLASAVFFYVYPQPPKPSMLFVVDGSWQPNAADKAANISAGFAATTNIINGGIECGQGVAKQQELNRVSYYQSQAGFFGVPIDRNEQLSCVNMQPFPPGGAGAQLLSWEQDWSYHPELPGGNSYACKLVSYQTRFNALKPGDYVRCVEYYFNVTLK